MRQFSRKAALLLSPAMLSATCAAAWGSPLDRSALPIPAPPFAGRIGESVAESTPSWPIQVTAPAGAPNIIVIMTDDTGFGASSAFGGPVPTPNFDRLAAEGLRYNNFFTTAICSPSRAALLTGRNAHSVGAGHLVDVPAGYPGYNTDIPRSAATIGRILGGNGFSTAFFGKHHNVPIPETTGAGPFDHWPTGLGFDYFFGILGWGSDQWHPRLIRGISRLEDRPDSPPELLDKRLADDAIDWIHNQKAAAPDRPFFIYYAPGSTHSPHQAPPEWIARFRGKFDAGWDRVRQDTFARQINQGIIPANTKLTPRPEQIPAWDTLSEPMKHVNARSMEVYAAQLAYQDAQLGRIFDELERMGQFDNTLILFVQGDNGASAEAGPKLTFNELGKSANQLHESEEQLALFNAQMGGPRTSENYSVGWAYAMNTPFQWFKQIASHEGGTHTSMVACWPDRIHQRGGMRSNFAYLTDILPTVLDAARIPAPARVDGVDQQRLDGFSLLPTFDDPAADVHHVQYFEVAGNRAIYKDGWMASTTPRLMPWSAKPLSPLGEPPHWELYDLRRDFSQAQDLAAANPAKLGELKALWDSEARANDVYPVDDRPMVERSVGNLLLRPNGQRTHFTYWGKGVSVGQDAAPSFAARSFTITADIDVEDKGPSGVLLATGSWFGGWSFYLKAGRPVVWQAVSQYPQDQIHFAADTAVPRGRSTVTYSFTSDGGAYAGGEMRIAINGTPVAARRISRTIALAGTLGETLDVGRDTGIPVTDDYDRNAFAGQIDRVDIELGPQSFGAAAKPAAIDKQD